MQCGWRINPLNKSEEIREKSQRYGEETAEILSELVKIPSL
jgi:hypothetical protein